jgi:hypothetical protein
MLALFGRLSATTRKYPVKCAVNEAAAPRFRTQMPSPIALQGRKAETEAAPIRYVAQLIGDSTDSERAIRWLIALIVLCCDPLAIALCAEASARK